MKFPVLLGLAGLVGCGPVLIEPGKGRLVHPAVSPPVATDVMPSVPADSAFTLPRSPDAFYHPVADGESLSDIARRYGTSVEALREANGLDDDSRVVPGQLVHVPGVESGRGSP